MFVGISLMCLLLSVLFDKANYANLPAPAVKAKLLEPIGMQGCIGCPVCIEAITACHI